MMIFRRRLLSCLLSCLFVVLLLVPVYAADPVQPDYGFNFDQMGRTAYVDLLEDSLFFVDGDAVSAARVPAFSGTRLFGIERSSSLVSTACYITVESTAGFDGLTVTYGQGRYAPTSISNVSSTVRTYYFNRATQASSFLWSFESSNRTSIYIRSAVCILSVSTTSFPNPSSTLITNPKDVSTTLSVVKGSPVSYVYTNPGTWSTIINAWSCHVRLAFSLVSAVTSSGFICGTIYTSTEYTSVSFDSVLTRDDATFSTVEACPITNVSATYGSGAVPCQLRYTTGTAPGSLRGRLDFAVPVSSLVAPNASSGILYLDFDIMPSIAFQTSVAGDFNLYYYFTLQSMYSMSDTSSNELALFATWYEAFIRSQLDIWTVTFSDYMDAILEVLGASSESVTQAQTDVANAGSLESSYVSAGADAAASITDLGVPDQLMIASPVLSSVSGLLTGNGSLAPLFLLLVILPVSVGIIAKLLNGGD